MICSGTAAPLAISSSISTTITSIVTIGSIISINTNDIISENNNNNDNNDDVIF